MSETVIVNLLPDNSLGSVTVALDGNVDLALLTSIQATVTADAQSADSHRQAVAAQAATVQVQHDNVVVKHGEVEADRAEVSALKDAVVAIGNEAATDQQQAAADRAAVELIQQDVALRRTGIAATQSDIAIKHQQTLAAEAQVQRQSDDVDWRHERVIDYHKAVTVSEHRVALLHGEVEADSADVTAKHDEVRQWHTGLQDDQKRLTELQQELLAVEPKFDQLLEDVKAAEANIGQINSKVTAVETWHGEVQLAQSDVEADRAEVASHQQDVQTRQADVVARQNDVIARQSAITSAAAQALSDIASGGSTETAKVTAEGDSQTARVTAAGDNQFNRISTAGQAKVDDATTQATSAASSASAAASSASSAETHKTGAQTAQNLAQQWAENPEDDEVTSGQYSALHHSAKARAQADSASSDRQATKTLYDQAVVLKDAAASSASAASDSETNASASETNAANSATAASASELSASNDAAQVASDKTAVAGYRDEVEADRAEVASNTGLTLGYRDEAKTARDQAVNAAASMAGALTEAGNFDASGNTLPPKPVVSTFWKITAAGTLDNVDYGIGDSLVYSLNTDSFFKIDNTESVTRVNGQQGVVTLDASDVGAKADSYVPDWSEITNKPDVSTPADHSHAIDDVTGLQAALDGKSASGHSHSWTEVTGKPTEFNPATHGHDWGDITNKPVDYTPAAHDHNSLYYTQTEVDGFLAGKSDSHAHPYRADTWVPTWDDITGKPTDFASSDHDHAIADVTGLQAALDAKLADAPENGKQHARIDGAWAEVDGLPDQTGQAGKTLQTDGTTASWQMPSGGGGDVTEAPEDGKLYFRKDGQWAAVEDTYLESSPIGITALWDGSSTPPAGWLECNGQEITESQYPELFALYKDQQQAGKAFLPDHRGEFLRGWDNGRGVDAGRALGSHQGDEFKEHTHILATDGTTGTGNLLPDQYIGATSNSFPTAYHSYYALSQGVGTPTRGKVGETGGTENRPRNNAVMVIIKAVSGPNLLSQIATPQRTVINASTGQQNFSHSYEVGRPLWVYMNGVKLIQGDDFTATDGSTISLTSPLVADTDIEIESFGKIVLSDMIGDSTHDGQSYVRKDGAWVTEKIADYALLDFGTVTKNSRYVQDNPFGNNTMVICVAEIFHNNKWSQTGFIYNASNGSGYGTQANYVQGEGIVVQTGGGYLTVSSNNGGGGHGSNSTSSPSPCRVHVWRVEG